MNETLIRIILDILVIITIILVILWKAVAARKNGRPAETVPVETAPINLEMIPGHAEECGRRGEEITKLVTNYEYVVKQISGINKNIDNLWKYVRKNGIS